MSTVSGIQGQLLDVTVVGCTKLKDTELFSRQDPYVCLEYANSKFRTRTCTDGGRNPTFQEKFQIPLIEGLREISVAVWNSNTFSHDDFIGSGRVQLHKVLSQGYDDSSWPIQTRNLKAAGEVKLIMHYANTSKQKPTAGSIQSAPLYMPTAPPMPYAPYAPPPPYPTTSAYAATSTYGAYPNPNPSPSPYPAPAYPPMLMQQPYPAPPYPPAAYPPPPYTQPYPPPAGAPYHPRPGPYLGSYPPPY